jgi:hypothetical protein
MSDKNKKPETYPMISPDKLWKELGFTEDKDWFERLEPYLKALPIDKIYHEDSFSYHALNVKDGGCVSFTKVNYGEQTLVYTTDKKNQINGFVLNDEMGSDELGESLIEMFARVFPCEIAEMEVPEKIEKEVPTPQNIEDWIINQYVEMFPDNIEGGLTLPEVPDQVLIGINSIIGIFDRISKKYSMTFGHRETMGCKTVRDAIKVAQRGVLDSNVPVEGPRFSK